MNKGLSNNELEKIKSHFGEDFLKKVQKDIQIYSKKWDFEILKHIDYYSVNCIFICRSLKYGDTVLKIGNPCQEVMTEVNLLQEYNGHCFCKIYDSDIENGIILEEYINPGTRLREEKSLEKRLHVFAELYNGLHIESSNSEIYPSYYDWVKRITEFMSSRSDNQELYTYMKRAEMILSSLITIYSKKMLLHGDLHHDNILLGSNNVYKIIDPKGVNGDPIFDVSRFILNEFYDDDNITFDYYRNHVAKIMEYFKESLKIPIEVMKKCLFIETIMANCWNVESNEKPDMNSVAYANAIMDIIE